MVMCVDPIVTHGPYQKALEIQDLYIVYFAINAARKKNIKTHTHTHKHTMNYTKN